MRTACERVIAQNLKPKLAAMPLGRLWARKLSMLTAHWQFPLILRLVAIAMTLTTDTSRWERLISPMSDFQTGFHSQTQMARRTRPAARRPKSAVQSNCGGPLKWIG